MATPATPYTDVLWPAGDYDEYTWTWRPLTSPSTDGYFWAHQLGISNGATNGPGGYVGAQTLGTGLGGKAVVFSLAGSMVTGATILAPGGTASVVDDDFDGGPGYSTRIAYNWQVGHTYAFRIWLDRTVGGTAWWRASVHDVAANTTTLISEIGVDAEWNELNGYSILWTERYSGPTSACGDFQRALADFDDLRASGTEPQSVTTTLGAGDCEQSAFADRADGVRQVVGSTSLVASRIELLVDGANLVEPFDVEWSDPLNRLGGFSFSLTNDDPQRSDIALGEPVTIVKDGIEAFYGRVESIRQTDTDSSEIGTTTYSGRRCIAELERVRVFPALWPAAGVGQAAGYSVAPLPVDRTRLFGWPDPSRAGELYVDSARATNLTPVTQSRPIGWPDPTAYWVGEETGASVAYFTGQIAGSDMIGPTLTYWVSFGGEGQLYHNGVLVLAVTPAEADQSKCWRVTVPVNPGVDQIFTVRVSTAGTTSPNAIFVFTAHDPENSQPKFFFRTLGPGQAWGLFADPATPPGTTPGQIVSDIVAEFETRAGEPLGWTFTFDADTDSAGDPWPTLPIFPVSVGDSLIDVLERLADAWIEWGAEVDTTARTLSLWNAPGVDLPDSTTGTGRGSASGVTLSVGDNVLELVHEVTE